MTPTASQAKIMAEIVAERSRQDAKWGGPEHDDQHSLKDWSQFIEDYATRVWLNFDDEARRRLIQIAALAVAALESIDRKEAAHE